MTERHLLEFFEACNSGDIDAIAGFFTDDAEYYGSIGPDNDGTVFRGIEGVRDGMSAFLGSYRDARYSDVVVHVAGDRGFAMWTFTGIAFGRPISYRGVDILEFRGDLIRRKDAFRKERSDPIGS